MKSLCDTEGQFNRSASLQLQSPAKQLKKQKQILNAALCVSLSLSVSPAPPFAPNPSPHPSPPAYTYTHTHTHTHTHTQRIRVSKCLTHLDTKVTACTWYDDQKEEEDVQKNVITLNESVAFISCWKNGRQAHWDSFYHWVFVFLLKKRNTQSMTMEIWVKLKVSPDSLIMWHPWGIQFSTSDRNEGNGIGKSEL